MGSKPFSYLDNASDGLGIHQAEGNAMGYGQGKYQRHKAIVDEEVRAGNACAKMDQNLLEASSMAGKLEVYL